MRVNRVVIGTPVYNDLMPEFVQSLIDTLALLRERRHLATWIHHTGTTVHRSRNLLAAQQLRSGADVLVQIDADMGWHAVDLVAGIEIVLGGQVDLLGYAAPNRRPGAGTPAFVSPILLPGRARGIVCNGARLIEVRSIGGIIVASRRAALRMSEIAEQDGRGVPVLFAFEHGLGEDVFFAHRWREVLGGKVHCMVDPVITHFGRVAYQGDFASSLPDLKLEETPE